MDRVRSNNTQIALATAPASSYAFKAAILIVFFVLAVQSVWYNAIASLCRFTFTTRMRNSVTSKVLKPVRRLFDGATSYAARCKPSPEALAQFQAYQRFRRSAQHVLSQIQCAALPAGQARRAQRAVFAASGILASSVAAVKGSLSHRRATIEEAAEDCTKLLSSVVKTPFKTYWRERLFTVECQPPYSDAPVLVITHGYAAGSGMFCFDLDRLAQVRMRELTELAIG